MAELSELDKETLREIVEMTFSDLTYINMDRIYSKIEELLPESGVLIAYAKNEDENGYYDADELDELEDKFISIMTCGLTINMHQVEKYDEIVLKLYNWLRKRPVQ